MFEYCSSLKQLNISNFNTSNVVDMNKMFHRCSSLTILDFSNFSVNKGKNLSRIFSECISLKEFNFPDFNPVNINTNNMFYAITFELSEKIKAKNKKLNTNAFFSTEL